MAKATLRYGADDRRDYTPSGAAAAAGDVVILPDNRVGVVVSDTPDGTLGTVYTEGVFDIDSATGTTGSAGDTGYLDVDDSNKVVTSGATGDIRCGALLAAKTSGQLVATIDLNSIPGVVHS